jgi:hypothetical protein
LIDREQDAQELKNVYDQPEHAKAQKELHAELERLRKELKVPAVDPPRRGRKKNQKSKQKS